MTKLIFFRYVWIGFMAVGFFNGLGYWMRARRVAGENPELADGCRTMAKGFMIWLNIPFAVTGFGCLTGHVPSVLHFFRPQDGNPYVLAFYAATVLLWVLVFHWLFLRGGAELLAPQSGASPSRFGGPTGIKLLYFLMVAGGIAGVIIVVKLDLPVDRLLQ